MTRTGWVLIVMLLAGINAGTMFDETDPKPAVWRGPYRVLEADFHVHTRYSDGFSSPMDMPFLARRQGLDVVAVTEHNNVFPGKIARAFSQLFGGARVLVGEEITSSAYHLIAVGLEERIESGMPIEETVARVHAQHGVAIAAHPVRQFWPVFERAGDALDGAEVMHPIAFRSSNRGVWRWHDMVEFFEKSRARGHPLAAIGSSDYHFFKVLGACRTLVFAVDDSEEAVLEALHAARTVVFDREGKAYGDPAMIALLEADPLPDRGRPDAPGYEANGLADAIGRALGWLGLIGLLLFARTRR